MLEESLINVQPGGAMRAHSYMYLYTSDNEMRASINGITMYVDMVS